MESDRPKTTKPIVGLLVILAAILLLPVVIPLFIAIIVILCLWVLLQLLLGPVLYTFIKVGIAPKFCKDIFDGKYPIFFVYDVDSGI